MATQGKQPRDDDDGDDGLSEFERGLLTSMEQALRGEVVAHTPEQIMARRRGRPVGSVKADAKEHINIRLSPDVLEYFRAAGDGWQTRIDAALQQYIAQHGQVKKQHA